MKIPIQLSLKYFDEQVTVKKKVEDMHIGEFMEMQKNILIPIFTEKAYEDSIIAQANRIKQGRKKPLISLLKKIFLVP
jgi:hypothetical protein